MKKFTSFLIICLVLSAVSVVYGGGNTDTKAPASGTASVAWTPDRDFTIRVPFAAGDIMDVATRIAGKGLERTYGKNTIVKNMTGANGTIAGNDLLSVAAAPTELMAGGIAMFVLAPLFNKGISLKLEDYKMVSGLISEDWFLCVNTTKTGIKNWTEFVNYTKNNRMIFSARAPGSAGHMLATAMFGEAGIKAEHLATDTAAKDVQAILTGDAGCTLLTTAQTEKFVGAPGDVITPIAVFSEDPSVQIGNYQVPSIKSLGFDIAFKTFNFLFTRASVDQSAVDSIYKSLIDYYATPEFKAQAEKINFVPDTSDGATAQKILENARDMCKRFYDKYYAR
jgi:tripartite-type tricarboxylate transporter receptor subunit TctC